MHKCRKCGSASLYTEKKGNATGLYCRDCGAWLKWLGKEELRAFNANQKIIREASAGKETSIKMLNDLWNYIDKEIDKEMGKMPIDVVDASQKNGYCLTLERIKSAITEIIKVEEGTIDEVHGE